MGTQLNPLPINFPHLSIQVQFFSGMGMGGPKIPQGRPCRSLDGLRCHGGDSRIVKSYIHVYYTVVMYTYKKCYMGFCTSGKLKNTFLHFFTLFCKKVKKV